MVKTISEMIEIKLPSSRVRSITAQIIASLSSNFLALGYGISITFATIVIPEVLNKTEGLSLDDNQASWFGSIAFLAQPFGALVSGPIADYLGRKKTMFLVNIPHVIAWILMYFSWNLPSLFIANALLGLGTGFMEAPISSYTSEVSEASIRGILCSSVALFLSIGVAVLFVVGAAVNWRTAALISLSIPIISMIMASLVIPETPIWLLSQGKEKEALKSLCFLRGWTTSENVREEFDQLIEYSKSLNGCILCNEENKDNNEKLENIENDCEHNKMNVVKRFFKKFKTVMFCKETLRPLVFCMILSMIYVMTGLNAMKPYMVNICDAMGMAEDSMTITIMTGVLFLVGIIILIGIVQYLGKRKVCLLATVLSGVCCTVLSVYAGTKLDDNVFSYNPKTYPKEKSMVPLISFYGLAFFTGVNVVCWILIAEVFPFRSRAWCLGIVAAWNYVVNFVGSKTLIDVETNFKLTGVFAVYAIFSYVGSIYFYFYTPETEGKTLEEIESFYKGEHRIFADDWFINKFKKSKRDL